LILLLKDIVEDLRKVEKEKVFGIGIKVMPMENFIINFLIIKKLVLD
tara:strand:+ start:250 stop:390 length:141 start_codon:yes stop_codon:yes gene_type:complete